MILGVIVLGLQFSRSGNDPLGYLLLSIGVVAGISWIYSHYRKKLGVPKRVGRLRVELTWATAAVLVTFVIYPWLPKPQEPVHETAQTVAIPAPIVETSTAPSPAHQIASPPSQLSHESKATSSAPIVQTQVPAGLTRLSFGDDNTLVKVPKAAPRGTGDTVIRPTDSRASTVIGPDQTPVTLTYSQTGNTVAVRPSGRIDSHSLAFFFDVDVSLVSSTCIRCGNGRLKDSNGVPDNKTLWIFWASPPLTPDDPLSVTFSSATPAKLLKVTIGPQPPR